MLRFRRIVSFVVFVGCGAGTAELASRPALDGPDSGGLDGGPPDAQGLDGSASAPSADGGCGLATDPCAAIVTHAPVTKTCNAGDYGLDADARDNSKALQKAIEDCKGTTAGAGRVVVPAGQYLTGTLRLRSHLVLHLDQGAVIRGILPPYPAMGVVPTDLDAFYPPHDANDLHNANLSNCRRALVLGEELEDVVIEGPGTIDGSGAAAVWRDRSLGDGGSVRNPETNRPIAVWFEGSSSLTLRDVTIADSAMWSLVLMESQDVDVRNVVVDSPTPKTKDGIDIVDSQRVCVRDSTITSEDDGICLKTGALVGVHDIHVVHTSVHGTNGSGGPSPGNGLKLGTQTYGDVSNVCFEGIAVDNYREAAMAVESVDGARVENVTFRDIVVHDVSTPFFVLLGNRGTAPQGGVTRLATATIDGLRFEHVRGTRILQPWGSAVSGTAFDGGALRVGAVAFVDVGIEPGDSGVAVGVVPAAPPEFTPKQYPSPLLPGWAPLPAFGFYFRHVRSVQLHPLDAGTADIDVRPFVAKVDVDSFVEE